MKNKEQHIFPFLERLLDGAEVEWKKLGEVSTQISGMSGVSNKWASKGNCRFIDYLNAYKHIKIDINQLPFATVKKLNQTELRQGDILFTSASETPDECAISSVIEDKIIAGVFLDDHLFGIRINEEYKEIIDSSFLNYYFRSPDFRKIVNKAVRGVTRFYISKVAFMRLSIPIPPLSIQKRIVEILDKFTTLEAELDCRKRQYEFYRNQLLSFDMLNRGGQRLNNVILIPLGNIGEVCMCKRILKQQTSEKGDVPFYKIGTFGKVPNSFISKELFYKYKEKYNYPVTGEVLISASGTIGRAVIYDGKEAYFQDSNIVWIKNDESQVLNKYLYYYYQIAKWNVAEGGTIQRLYNDNLRKTLIPIPYSSDRQKSLAEQHRIVSILDKFDTLVNSISEGLPKEIELRRKQYEYYREQLLSFRH